MSNQGKDNTERRSSDSLKDEQPEAKALDQKEDKVHAVHSQAATQDEKPDMNGKIGDSSDQQEEHDIIDPDPYSASNLFGKSPEPDEDSLWSDISSDEEDNIGMVDPDPFGASKFFTQEGVPLGFDNSPVMIQDALPPVIDRIEDMFDTSLEFVDNPVMVQDALPPVKNTYRRETLKYRRKGLIARDRLLDFISNNDAAEMFDSPEFSTILAEAEKDKAKNEKEKAKNEKGKKRVHFHSRSRSRSRSRPRPQSTQSRDAIVEKVDDSSDTSSWTSDESHERNESDSVPIPDSQPPAVVIGDNVIVFPKKVSKARTHSGRNYSRREREGKTFRVAQSQEIETAQAIQELTWSQIARGQARFHSFEKVQMIKLYHGQQRLAKELSRFFDKNKTRDDADLIIDLKFKAFSKLEWTGIESQLSEYIQGLRDLHWTKSVQRLSWSESKSHTQNLLSRFGDAAYTSPLVFDMNPYIDLVPPNESSDMIRRFLSKILPSGLTAQDRTQHKWDYGKIGVSSQKLRAVPSTQTFAVDYLARFILAIFTGAMLMAPIIAMSFVNSQDLRLIISSVFVVGFSVILSFATNSTNQEIIGGSAAYAAIIVVFVGSALSSSS